MRWLSIDTATETCSVAVCQDQHVIADIRLQMGRTHARQLAGTLEIALKMAESTPADIEAMAVGIGPGSFTGLRIGMSTAKGMAMALGIPLVGVPTLAALALQVRDPDRLICPMIDARRHQVYWAGYRFTPKGLIPVLPVRADSPDAAAEAIGRPCVLVGSGVRRYRDRVLSHLGDAAVLAADDLNDVRAAAVAYLAARQLADHPDVAARGPNPLYVRPTDAKMPTSPERTEIGSSHRPGIDALVEKDAMMD